MGQKNEEFKEAIYEQFARIGKAISSPKRLELIDLLAQGERTVEVLAHEAGLSVANTSQHLQVLRSVHLVEARKKGLYVTYYLGNPAVCEFMRSLRSLARNQLAEVDRITRRFLGEQTALDFIDRETLIKRVKQGTITVIDVRPVEEYRAAHIPGSRSIPIEELERRLAELPSDQDVVAYCRGAYCMLAIQAVAFLRKHGYQALRLEEGIPEWRALGLEVESGGEGK